MLFSSPSPRQRMVTLRAWFEKNIAACPAELPAPTMWTSQAVGARRVAARRAVRDALAGEPVEAVDREAPPRDTAREDDRPRAQDVAAVEVQLPRRGVDPRDRPGDEDLGAEPARLLEGTARELVARDAGREAEVVLDPGRRAGLAAGRLPLDDDRPQALRRSVHGRGQPGGPAPTITVSYSAAAGSVARPSSSATWRSCGRTTVLPSTARIAGQSSSGGSGPPHCSAASGASGSTDVYVIWLRSRKRRSSAQATSQRCPIRIARGGGGSAASPRARRAGDPVGRELADLRADVRRHGGDGVVVVRPRAA